MAAHAPHCSVGCRTWPDPLHGTSDSWHDSRSPISNVSAQRTANAQARKHSEASLPDPKHKACARNHPGCGNVRPRPVAAACTR